MRYALYFAPREDSALWRAGCRWLGRDAVSGARVEQPMVSTLDPAALAELTAAPRRYGFHATLKAPFPLAEGAGRDELFAAVAAFACGRTAFRLPPLEAGGLGAFLALRTTQPCAELEALAADCVAQFDRFRTQAPGVDRARRGSEDNLSARQRALLERWGYPYVMDEWRFHMTLTGPMDTQRRDGLLRFLNDWFANATREPEWVSDICVFVEPEPGGEFRLAARFPMRCPP